MDKNKRTALKLFAIAGTVMAISLLFCLIVFYLLPFRFMQEKTDYKVELDKDSFSLECNYFNGTESGSFELVTGDEIEVNYVCRGGRFDVTIGQLGKEAKGSLAFQIKPSSFY
ncbi:MAG: hypothetical protein J6A94_00550 [Lachnospiraceae bacterium]|nr:hypothetical protein [Lachnospiraceae bacterium]